MNPPSLIPEPKLSTRDKKRRPYELDDKHSAARPFQLHGFPPRSIIWADLKPFNPQINKDPPLELTRAPGSAYLVQSSVKIHSKKC